MAAYLLGAIDRHAQRGVEKAHRGLGRPTGENLRVAPVPVTTARDGHPLPIPVALLSIGAPLPASPPAASCEHLHLPRY